MLLLGRKMIPCPANRPEISKALCMPLGGRASLPSMAQAIMNPEEVRRFAAELKRFNTDMQQRAASLQARFSALGETWQDAEHEKFAAEFLTTMKAIRKFMEMSEQHTPFLLRKAQRIEDYLNQR